MSPHLSSPNRLVRAYASSARTLAAQAIEAPSDDDAREHVVATNAMAVACVETYLNVFARLWISQDPDFPHCEQIENDLRTKKNLGRKLEEWPKLFFGMKADFGSGAGQRFRACLDRRNRLMHFHSDTHTFEWENIVINGLIDSTAYETLTREDAFTFVQAAEGFIEYLLQLQGIAAEQLPHALHHWLGRVPSVA
jgi:hypothetical protein